jgi:hypothetical protein
MGSSMIYRCIIGSSMLAIYLNLGVNGTEMGVCLGRDTMVVRVSLIRSNSLWFPLTNKG